VFAEESFAVKDIYTLFPKLFRRFLQIKDVIVIKLREKLFFRKFCGKNWVDYRMDLLRKKLLRIKVKNLKTAKLSSLKVDMDTKLLKS